MYSLWDNHHCFVISKTKPSRWPFLTQHSPNSFTIPQRSRAVLPTERFAYVPFRLRQQRRAESPTRVRTAMMTITLTLFVLVSLGQQ